MNKGIFKFALILLLFVALVAAVSTSRDIWDTRNVRVLRAGATGSAALSTSLAPSPVYAFRLIEVRMKLSSASATSEDFTATIDSHAGAEYDTRIFAQDMDGVTYLVWKPEEERYFQKGDELDFAWANSNSRTYGLEILYTTAK